VVPVSISTDFHHRCPRPERSRACLWPRDVSKLTLQEELPPESSVVTQSPIGIEMHNLLDSAAVLPVSLSGPRLPPGGRACDPECPVCGHPPEPVEIDCPEFCPNYSLSATYLRRLGIDQ
jgi:hypothetical protein